MVVMMVLFLVGDDGGGCAWCFLAVVQHDDSYDSIFSLSRINGLSPHLPSRLPEESNCGNEVGVVTDK